MGKCYIAGKVSGMPYEKALRNFQSAEDKLKRLGFHPINPTRLCRSHWGWHRCMIVCLWNLLWCGNITMLYNWRDSRGARIEYKVAKLLNKRFVKL